MPKFSFPLIKSSPTDSEYAEICTGGGSRPPCQLKVTAYSGAAPPSNTYGNLSIVNLPLQSSTADCETLIDVWLQPGCPAGTPDVVCDDAQNPTEITPDSSETIYILDGDPPYSWEVVGGHGYTLQYESTNDLGGRPDERLNSQNILYASPNSCGVAEVKITDNCQTELICEFPSSESSNFEYDWTNSAQTVARNSNANIFVVGGAPPYIWYVSGVDFSLQSTQTYSLENKIYAGPTACGSATITIEDICGVQIEGSVRCTTGSWVHTETASDATGRDACGPVFGTWTGPISTFYDVYRGKYRVAELNECKNTSTGSCSDCDILSYQFSSPISCPLGRIPLCSEYGYGTMTEICCQSVYLCCLRVVHRYLYEWGC